MRHMRDGRKKAPVNGYKTGHSRRWFWSIIAVGVLVCPVAGAVSLLVQYLAVGPPNHPPALPYPEGIVDSLMVGSIVGLFYFSPFHVWSYVAFAFIARRHLRSRSRQMREIPASVIGATLGLTAVSAALSAAIISAAFAGVVDVGSTLVLMSYGGSGLFLVPILGFVPAACGWFLGAIVARRRKARVRRRKGS